MVKFKTGDKVYIAWQDDIRPDEDIENFLESAGIKNERLTVEHAEEDARMAWLKEIPDYGISFEDLRKEEIV